jgi:EAL domain-containing protein (putative c-di-GMP-specific phosphodiesterase class I)
MKVNVSPRQLAQSGFVPHLRECLATSQADPDHICLEVNERGLLEHLESAWSTLREAKALGVSLALDDFGTGYSSLGNLRSFPFDKIKIDRSFVSDLEQNADSAAIVHAILGLGHSLGISTCAEGVETKGQLSYLRREGCSEVQGYYYSIPKPLIEAAAMLKRGTTESEAPLVPDVPGEAQASATQQNNDEFVA